MKSLTRYSARFLSAVAIAALAATSSAEASGWPPSGLISRLTGQTGEPPTAPAASSGDNPTAGSQVPRLPAPNGRYHDGSFAGPAYNTYYGPVQVQVNIQDGRVISIEVPQYPADRRASQRINSRALPMLEREVISAQSARVNIISGATLTSEAYLRSLDAALHDADSATPGVGI